MYRYAAISDIGPEFQTNDDRILIGNTLLHEGKISGISNESFLAAGVADGVGGLQMGYKAAEIALEYFSELNKPGIERTDIRNSVENANDAIISTQNAWQKPDGLRTTLAAVYLSDCSSYIINAGDSRVYRLRNGKLECLSKDHSVVQNLVDSGDISEEEAFYHPQKNVITKCLGNEERVNARIIDISGEVFENDLFLICSDGIADCIKNNDLEGIILDNSRKSIMEICEIMVQKALTNGSTDNISVCLIRKEAD